MVNFLKLPKATFNLRGNFQAQFVKMLFPEPWRGRGNGDGSGGGSGKVGEEVQGVEEGVGERMSGR